MSQQTITEQGAFSADVASKVNANFSELYSGTLVHQASRTLTNAEIKKLPSTPQTIIAAPGANRIVFKVRAVYRMQWVADYSGVDAESAILYFTPAYAGDFGTVENASNSYVELLFAGGGPDGVMMWPQQTQFVRSPIHVTFANGGAYDSDIVNQPGQVYLDGLTGGTADLGDGNSGNALQICCEFRVFDLTLGRFLSVAESGWDESTRTFS